MEHLPFVSSLIVLVILLDSFIVSVFEKWVYYPVLILNFIMFWFFFTYIWIGCLSFNVLCFLIIDSKQSWSVYTKQDSWCSSIFFISCCSCSRLLIILFLPLFMHYLFNEIILNLLWDGICLIQWVVANRATQDTFLNHKQI